MTARKNGLTGAGWIPPVVVGFLAMASLAFAAPATARPVSAAARSKCALHRVADKRVCLRAGERCTPAVQHDYLKARLECRARRLRRASLAALREGEPVLIDAHGRIDPRNALEAFNTDVAHLPGVRTRKGAVGPVFDATEIITGVEAQRSRLTRAQRAVLDHVLRPKPTAVPAETPADDAAFAGLVGEAAARIRAHGFALNHKVALIFPPTEVGQEPYAYTVPGWLDRIPGYSDACLIYVTPLGVAQDLAYRREIVTHELFHCAQSEFYGPGTNRGKIPLWLREGSADWVGSQIGLEWNGFDRPEGSWTNWLQRPELDLGKRAYDGIGFWSLLQQTGLDVFARLRNVIPAAASGGDGAAYGTAIAGIPAAFFDTWGPGFVRSAFVGPNWDLTGPGIIRSPPISHVVINDGTDWGRFVDQRGALGQDLSFEAEVITIQSTASHGRIYTLDGEAPLRTELLCTKDGGCSCPNGKLNTRQVPKGIAFVGWQGGGVSITGTSVSNECEKEGKGPAPTAPPHTPACTLLARAGVQGFVGAGGFLAYPGGACVYNNCPQTVDQGGQRKCAYGRGAMLVLSRNATAKRARDFVRRRFPRPPYRAINIGADAAVIATRSSGGAVEMAVGRTVATLTMGAHSDTNPNPVWHNEPAVIELARRIARRLH